MDSNLSFDTEIFAQPHGRESFGEILGEFAHREESEPDQVANDPSSSSSDRQFLRKINGRHQCGRMSGQKAICELK